MANQLAVVLTWMGGVDARSADHLGRGRANRNLDGALLRGRELLRRGLLVVLWRRGLWSLMHHRRHQAGRGATKIHHDFEDTTRCNFSVSPVTLSLHNVSADHKLKTTASGLYPSF